MRIYIIIFLIFALHFTNVNAQIDSNRPTNTVRYQNIHFVVDQGAANVGVATVEQKHNKSLEFLKQILLTDTRIKNLHIIPRADNEYVTNISGVNGQSDLGNFANWVHDSANNCDFRDIQSFVTSTSHGGPVAGNAFTNLSGLGFAIHSLYHGPRNDLTLAHEWAHSIDALDGDHVQGIGYFNVKHLYENFNPVFIGSRKITSTGWGFGNSAEPFFSTPISFNSYAISNGGYNYLTIDEYDGHLYIPVDLMDNINDTANRTTSQRITQNNANQNNWCSVENFADNIVQSRNTTSYTNTTTGVFEHYQNHMNYLRTETVSDLTTPQITLTNDKINVSNLSDYSVEYPNTTNPSYQNLYFTKGDYQVFVYENSDTSEGSQIAGPIPLGQIIVGLPINEYAIRIYEKWSNTLSDISSSVVLGVDNVEINDFSVYPNPTKNILNIVSSEKIKNVLIYNQLGQVVITNNSPTEIINILSLSNGIYFINVESENGHKSIRKIIKE